MSASVFSSRKPSQAGFTLVEIAIVLVIIGLLLGGILKGQEMINQARIKNAINDFNGVTVAVTSYQDRYRALPGDDGNAATRWSSLSPAPASGNGDGTIDGFYNTTVTAAAPTSAQETNLFWQHLRIAGFVPGITVGAGSGAQPLNSASGIVGVVTAVGPTPGPATGLGFIGTTICSSNIPDKVAIAVDTQMDDGNSATGQVRAQAQSGPNPTLTATPASAYVETGTSQYLVCKPLQ